MTNKRNTKRALLLSALSLLMCVSMLIGSTFAWFTDSVTSAGNTIISGTLDVDLIGADEKTVAGRTLEFVDKDGKVLSNILWEPGCTYTLEPVKVVNNGNLWLKYEIVISGIEGNAKLLEAIEWKVEGAALKGTLKPGAETAELRITGHMKEEAGNEYQGLEMAGISITVYATQVNAESDSFGPDYDKVAPLLVWDGSIDTSWYDASKSTYELSSPAKLAGLAKLVNEGNSFAGKTIKLAADMDLNNLKWTAIGTGSANFNGKFYGNGFTIYNLKVSGTKGVGLIGFAGNAAHIEGVHIVGANVTGENSVGAVLGYGYLAKDCLKNCIVENALVFALAGAKNEDGDKVGAVAGWTSNGNIIGNKAINCEIYGCRDIGGIVGYVNGENRAVEVSDNTVEKVTVNVIEAEGYDATKLGTNINDTVGRTGTKVTVQSNNGNITKVENTVVASTNEGLKDAAAAGGEVVVVAGNYTFPAASLSANTTLNCAPGTVFEGTSKLNIKGATVVGATFSNPTGTAADQTINGTFKDCTFTGVNGLRWCYAGDTVVFENCVFDGSTYGVHFDGGANKVVFKDCTISGFNAMGGAIELATFDGCTFQPGRSGYNGINLWGNTEMKGCTFVFDGTKTEWVDLCGDNKTATFTNCVVTDGKTEKGVETVVGDYGDGNTIIIDGAYYAATADQLRNIAANATGDVAIILGNNITLGDDTTQKSMGAYFPNATKVTINGKGKTLTLKGPMPGNDWHAQYYAGIIAPNATVTVKDLTIVNEKLDKNGNSYGADRESVYTMVRGTSVLLENVNFVGGVQVVNNTKFVGCTFEENVLVANDAGYATNGKFCVFIDFEYNANGVCTVDFEGCTFNATGYGCVKAAGDKGANITVNVKDCSFTNTCPSNNWSQSTPKYDVKATGNNITVNDLGGNTWAKGLA